MSSNIVKNLNIQIGLYNLLSTCAAFIIISAVYGLMIANGNALVEQLNSESNCQI